MVKECRTIKIGDIFYASWGYDQTNIDFVQVIGLTLTGKTATCMMMSKEHADESHVIPKEAFGITFRLKVKEYEGEPRLVGTYPFVQGENVSGGTRFDHFCPYEGKPVYETPFGLGH